MEEFIVICFALCSIIFLILALCYALVGILKDKDASVKYFNKKFNYKKIDNIYEEFIMLNSKEYKKVDYEIKLTAVAIVGSMFLVGILFLYEFLYCPSIAWSFILCALILLSFAAFIYSYGIKLPALLDKKNLLFKEKLIDYIVNECLKGFEYDPEGFISKEEYLKSKFYEKFDTFFSEDLIKGTLNGNEITIAEVETLKNNDNTNPQPVFHGVFAKISLKHKIKNNVIITTKDEQVENRNIVYTTNSEFNSLFNVYSDDKIETYTLLNERVQNELIELYKMFNLTMDIKIIKHDVFIRIHTGAIFDKLIFTLDEKKKVYEFSIICEVIKELNDSLSK